MFDANGNGKISADEINLDLVSAEILTIFKPLLVELEAFDEDLDKEEFVESSLALMDKLDINQKNQVLNFGKNRKVPKSMALHEMENRFHPIISKKSAMMAERKKVMTRDGSLPVEQRL